MEVKFKIAPNDMICARCADIGIPTPTILAGDEYFTLDGLKRSFGCMDCFDRLFEEVNEEL
jgi:hypothetical protein